MRHARMASPALPPGSSARKWLHGLHLLTDLEAGRLLGLPNECMQSFVLDRFDTLVPRAVGFMDCVHQVFRVRRVLAGSSTAGRTLVGSRQFTAACLHRLLSTPRECVVTAETWLYAALQRGTQLPVTKCQPNLGLVVALLVGDAESLSARVRHRAVGGVVTQAVLPASEAATSEWMQTMHGMADACFVLCGSLGPKSRWAKTMLVEVIDNVTRRVQEMTRATQEAALLVQQEIQQLQQQIDVIIGV